MNPTIKGTARAYNTSGREYPTGQARTGTDIRNNPKATVAFRVKNKTSKVTAPTGMANRGKIVINTPRAVAARCVLSTGTFFRRKAAGRGR